MNLWHFDIELSENIASSKIIDNVMDADAIYHNWSILKKEIIIILIHYTWFI